MMFGVLQIFVFDVGDIIEAFFGECDHFVLVVGDRPIACIFPGKDEVAAEKCVGADIFEAIGEGDH